MTKDDEGRSSNELPQLLYQKTTKISQEHLLAQDIPYRKGKVGARKSFPRK